MRLRILLFGAVALAMTAFAPPSAFAAAPVLGSVSHVKRHPAATWTLPAGVKSQVVEVATHPDVGSDGYFFTENVKVFDLLEEAQTSWLDSDQLTPGIYYVHVSGFDEPCYFAGRCPVREWSQVLPLVIPANKRPQLAAVRWQETGHNKPGRRYYVTEALRFRVCDDAPGPLFARVGQTKRIGPFTRGREVFVRRMTLAAAGCRSYKLTWRLKDKFFGVGRYTVTLRIRDAEGAWSRTVSRSSYTPD